MNIYSVRYEIGRAMWPVVHKTTIFPLVMAQIIDLGVFGLKESTVASGFMIPLVILTLLFNEYCRQRFQPVFTNLLAQGLSRWIRKTKKLKEWNKFTSKCFLPAASSQQKAQTVVSWTVKVKVRVPSIKQTHRMVINRRISIIQHLPAFQSIDSNKLLWLSTLARLPIYRLQQAVVAVSMPFSLKNRSLSKKRAIAS